MKTVMNAIYNGVVSSMGNMVATENKDVQENVFDISNFVCFIISGFITLELVFLFNPFISIWIGNDYLVPFWMVIVISLNFYFYSQMVSLDSMKIASGVYNIDKYVPLIQAAVNLIISIVLGKIIGLGGVILGTLVSYLTVGIIFKPYLLYKYTFNKKPYIYYLNQIKYSLVLIVSYFICYYCISNIHLSGLLNIFVIGIMTMIIYSLLVIIVFCKRKEMHYIIDIIKSVLNHRGGKNDIKEI